MILWLSKERNTICLNMVLPGTCISVLKKWRIKASSSAVQVLRKPDKNIPLTGSGIVSMSSKATCWKLLPQLRILLLQIWCILALPTDECLAFDDYLLYFNKDHSAKRWKIEGALIGNESSKNTIYDHQVQLSSSLFETDALVFKGLKSDEIIIKNSKTDSRLHFTFHNFPFLGIWTKPGAPYLCLEPWQGIADSIYHNGDFTGKEGILTLDPKNTFQCGYRVGFN